MKPISWDCCSRLTRATVAGLWALTALLTVCPAMAPAQTLEPDRAWVLLSDVPQPPPPQAPGWKPIHIPDRQEGSVAWYAVEFEQAEQDAPQVTMLYLPYLYGGGRIWLNGTQIATITESSEARRVRWERPMLIQLPLPLLRTGTNRFDLRLVAAHMPSGIRLPPLEVGPASELLPRFDRRLFLARTMPLLTVISGTIIGAFMLYIWVRHRREVLYGLFGMAAILWSLRTATFVFDTLPASIWVMWRTLYHASTGGFIIVMALFALELGGGRRRRMTWILGGYGVLGPLVYLISGDLAEILVGRYWTAGLIPVGLSAVAFTFMAAWTRRSADTVLMGFGTTAAVLAGIHDYLLAWSVPWFEALMPAWSRQRIFLMHHGANLLLVLMGGLLIKRFIDALTSVENANRTLEERISERETELAHNYQQIALLQREQATLDERQRIMQDLHDGLGAHLFTSLMRAERGALDVPGATDTLRAAIDEMRVAIEALTSDGHDFHTAFGNFRFRWDQRLRDAGLTSTWTLDWPATPFPISPHVTLQILRIVQEALTNVVKHAHASAVQIHLSVEPEQIRIVVRDDGRGFPPAQANPTDTQRGLRNMRARTRSLGGHLVFEPGAPGTTVRFTLDLASS